MIQKSKEYTREEVNQANIEYHDAMAERYNERPSLFHKRLNKMYENILADYLFKNWPEGSKASVLDVACGTGCLEEFLIKFPSDITGFDISPGMIEVAKKNYPQVTFLLGDAYNMPLAEGQQFDMVMENGALHHIKDYYDVIEAMCERVKPGGKLYLGCEPNARGFRAFSWLRGLYRKIAPEKRIEESTGERDSELEMVSEYHQFFTMGLEPKKIHSFLEDRGFENINTLYRTEHFVAQLYDRLGLNLISWLPTWILRIPGSFALNFHLVATKKKA